jgi:hypothetical protein
MPSRTIAVLGALLQDHTIIMDRQPENRETIIVNSYSAQMGDKGANSAVAVHRLSRLNPNRNLDTGPAEHTGEEDLDLYLRLVSAVGDDGPGAR